jgi:hypothetical protein
MTASQSMPNEQIVHDQSLQDAGGSTVQLLPSARFVTEVLELPTNVNGRDLAGFVESNIEEFSAFPLESTAWGFLEIASQQVQKRILAYAGYRDQVLGRSIASPDGLYAMLPGFACLVGLSVKQTSWFVLLEDSCMTLAKISAKENVPSFVRSVYLSGDEMDSAAVWRVRENLVREVTANDDEYFEDGLIRCVSSSVSRTGSITFTLEKQYDSDSDWKRYKTGKLASETVVVAADVREKSFLWEQRGRRASFRRLQGFIRFFFVFLLLLAVFQYRYLAKKRALADLSQQVVIQRPAVEALQEQERITKASATLRQAPLEIFAWMEAVNELRPDTMAFHVVYANRNGVLGFNGEAPSVLAVNQYREELEKTGQYVSVEILEISSGKRGVTFSMEVHIKKDFTDGMTL